MEMNSHVYNLYRRIYTHVPLKKNNNKKIYTQESSCSQWVNTCLHVSFSVRDREPRGHGPFSFRSGMSMVSFSQEMEPCCSVQFCRLDSFLSFFSSRITFWFVGWVFYFATCNLIFGTENFKIDVSTK